MKQNTMKLLYESTGLYENGFTANDGTKLAPGDQFPANNANAVPERPSSEQYVTVSRIGQACEKAPTFCLQGYDINDCAYGTLFAVGEEAKWRTDGNTVWTTLKIEDEMDGELEDYLSYSEIYSLFLYPVVAWYENKNEYMKDFRTKYQNKQATKDDCIRFSSAFHYGYALNHPEIELIDNCSESKCLPAIEQDIVVTDNAATSTTTANELPWQVASDVPNDLSVSAALNKRYHLNGQWGFINEGGKSYNFAPDMVPISDMQDYIDNPDYRDCLQQIVGYISSLFRTNNLVWDGSTPINRFLDDKHIRMRRSNQQNIMLAGEPGAGKTLLGRMLAATLGIPCAVIRLGERFEKDELTQEIIATEHGFDSIKSQMYWYVKYGGLIMFDDLSNADPNMFFSLTGGLLESPYEYVVNQEKVKRHPLCIMLATTNVGTIGSQPMNEALLTRFGGHYVVEKLADEAFKTCIIQRAQANSGIIVKDKTQKAIADWTFNVFNAVSKAVKTIDRETADRLITMRAAIGTAEKILNAVADGYAVDSKKAARQMMANILYTGGNPTLQKSVADAIDSAPALRI